MKQFIATFFLLIGLCNMATAQEGIFVHYEKMPEYPDGERQWKKDRDTYMETRLKELFPEAHPDSLATDETKRRIIMQFTIDKKGEVQMPSILRGLHPMLDNEAFRYVRQLPRFKPGTIKREPRDVKFTLPLFVHPYYLRLLERKEQQSTDTTVYKVVEKMPEYPGGVKQLVSDVHIFGQKFIKRHFPYDNPYFGGHFLYNRYSMVSFVIHENGQVTDAVITRSSEDPHSDRAALLFVKSMPRWIPGEQKGKKVKVKFTLPFTLHLQ
ncbi:MAG: TonB family protein [Bacteroidaceae bacterium]|nr:TonB family protein [Bacteroidaceae bacterium]